MARAAEDLPGDEPLDYGELAESVGFLLRIAQVQSFDMFFKHLSAQGLKPGEFTLLWVVGRNPGLRQGTLARQLRIKPAHMTKLVQRLVGAGYLSRKVPADDRRSVRLALTPAGEDFVASRRGAFLEFHAAERAALTDEEFRQLTALLAKLTGIGGPS